MSPWPEPPQRALSPEQAAAIDGEIRQLLGKGAVEVAPAGPHSYHQLFTVPKGAGWRPIADLRPLNQYVHPPRFVFQSLQESLRLIRQGFYFTKIDIKDAYLHMVIAPHQRRWLAFKWQGRSYRWRTLPFGLSAAPQMFSRLMAAALAHFDVALQICAYLDDLLLMAPSRAECLRHTKWLVAHLTRLGFLLHPDKSVLKPRRRVQFLGFVIDSAEMSVRIPSQKVRDLRRAVQQSLAAQTMSARELARIIGRLSACRAAIDQASFRLRPLEQLKAEWLAQFGWHHRRPLPEWGRVALCWWRDQLLHWNGRSLLPQAATWAVTTDASPTGLGGRLEAEASLETSLPWTTDEVPLHITARETLALFHSLQAFLRSPPMQAPLAAASRLRPLYLRWRTDSTVAMAVLSRQYSRAPTLNRIVQRIWSLLVDNNVRLLPQYLPGAQMVASGVDALSRLRDREAVALNPTTFRFLEDTLGPFSVDAMADRSTHRLPAYISRYPDARASAVDFFTVEAEGLGDHPYVNPPWSLIARVLQRLLQLRLPLVTLVLPRWDRAPWWPIVLRHLVRPLVQLPAASGFWLRGGSTPLPRARWDAIAATCCFRC